MFYKIVSDIVVIKDQIMTESLFKRIMEEEGPLPILDFPDIDKVNEVFSKLQKGIKVSDEDLELIIKQVVAENRDWLVRKIDENRLWYPRLADASRILRLSGEILYNLCGIARLDILDRLLSFGNGAFEVFRLSADKSFNFNETHASVVVRLKGSQKSFLIDTTLRQYFFNEEGAGRHNVGRYFMDKSNQLAVALLRDGYMEFTDQTAVEYGNAFNIAAGQCEAIFAVDGVLTESPLGPFSGALEFFSESENRALFEKYNINVDQRIASLKLALEEAARAEQKRLPQE